MIHGPMNATHGTGRDAEKRPIGVVDWGINVGIHSSPMECMGYEGVGHRTMPGVRIRISRPKKVSLQSSLSKEEHTWPTFPQRKTF